jgi:hypothetical protein
MEGPTEEFFRALDGEKGREYAIDVCEQFMEPMTVIVQEEANETPADMCAEMAANDFNFPDDHEGPGPRGDFEGEDFDEENFSDEEDEEEDLEDFDF